DFFKSYCPRGRNSADRTGFRVFCLVGLEPRKITVFETRADWFGPKIGKSTKQPSLFYEILPL
ncbi:hypothetical protein OAG51_03730, partial [Pirellulaceae bacterium]|nr:hypothetical protein [Pirellulaceae bacterium]